MQPVNSLATAFLDFGTALADFEFRIALANHVNSASSTNDLAIGVPVFQGTNAADDLHDNDLDKGV